MKNKNKTGFFPKRQNIYFINKTNYPFLVIYYLKVCFDTGYQNTIYVIICNDEKYISC